MSMETPEERLNYLRGQIEAESISWHELAELQGLGAEGLIPEDELTLREWAGLPEFDDAEDRGIDFGDHGDCSLDNRATADGWLYCNDHQRYIRGLTVDNET